MLKFITTAKSSAFMASVVILAAGSLAPVRAFADTPTCVPPAEGSGVHHPVGADASLYTYNCNNNDWESSHFIYDPATGNVTPKDPTIYTYNAGTGAYDTTTWIYDAPHNNYDAITTSVSTPPAGATVVGAPAPVSTISNTGTGSNNTIDNTGGVGAGTIDNTGTNSNNTIGGTTTSNTNDTNQNNLTATNNLSAQATTGNTLVIGNTTAGNATSGNAQDIANVVNMLQSSSNALGAGTVTFVANIDGNVDGNFLLDPSTLGSVQPAAANTPAGTNNLTLNNSTNSTINNNLNLAANSGDAGVDANTTAGNATSGSAEAIANVVNLIDSAISGGQSFVGVININGNLNGDIDVPQNFIDQLVASNVPTVSIPDSITNTGTDSNNAITTKTGSSDTNITNTNNEAINNNVNSTATTGTASVAGNTHAGNATSGSAANNITAFNLTGSNVIGSNDLLVFVNVLGTWVGMIINAPAGATAAELGGGITSNDSNGSNNNATINNKTNEQINNNITTAAKSGNADVTGNTTGGNATSGDAKNAVNLLNVENSSLNFSGWFGILFINVFGTWNGNFGVYTPPAVAAEAASAGVGGSGGSGGGSGGTVPASVRVFGFVPTGSGSVTPAAGDGSSNNVPDTSAAVLAAHVARTTAPTPVLQSGHRSFITPIIIGSLVLLYGIGEFYFARRGASK